MVAYLHGDWGIRLHGHGGQPDQRRDRAARMAVCMARQAGAWYGEDVSVVDVSGWMWRLIAGDLLHRKHVVSQCVTHTCDGIEESYTPV